MCYTILHYVVFLENHRAIPLLYLNIMALFLSNLSSNPTTYFSGLAGDHQTFAQGANGIRPCSTRFEGIQAEARCFVAGNTPSYQTSPIRRTKVRAICCPRSVILSEDFLLPTPFVSRELTDNVRYLVSARFYLTSSARSSSGWPSSNSRYSCATHCRCANKNMTMNQQI